MQKILLALVFVSLSFFGYSQKNSFNIIPEPVSAKPTEGLFVFNTQTLIVAAEPQAQALAKQFSEKLNAISKLETGVTHTRVDAKTPNTVWFLLSSDKVLGKEGYKITVSKEQIFVEANEGNGFFNALQTLYQLLPPEIYGSKKAANTTWSIPCCEIYDYPRFAYRGMHLDVARHFFPPEFVKRYIDLLAMQKINYFHWHLTDDQGWRVEIKKYPKLTEIGSKRSGTLIGHYSDNAVPQYDNKPYSGYYTQEEVKEIVAYAAEHYVTIVPEIELPGHASAAVTAYPELSCTGEKGTHEVVRTWGVFDDVFCPKEETFTFLENVLEEVMELFPTSPYIHIGGDECPKTCWKECAHCQDMIKQLNLKNEHELQSYFIGRISKFVIANGRKVIAWDEALEGGLPEDVIIMSWQGEAGGIEAARQKHQAIMTPTSYLYLNYYQGDPESEPLAIGGYVPLDKVYNYEPVPQSLKPEEQKYIIGAQANLWTEYIATTDMVEYMVFPRASALAEVAWSKKENKNWERFTVKLNEQFRRLDQLEVNYSKSHFNPTSKVSWNTAAGKPQVELQTACTSCRMRFTTDGSEPTIKSPLYVSPILLDKSMTVKAAAFAEDKISSAIYKQAFEISKSTGKGYKLDNLNPQYPGGGPLALIDGILATPTSWGKWVGLHGNDLHVVLDLGSNTEIKKVSLNYLNNPGSWIFLPLDTEVSVSADGKKYTKIETKDLKSLYDEARKIVHLDFDFSKPQNARYIKVTAKAVKKCPEGHPGAGYNAHLFIDEISVE